MGKRAEKKAQGSSTTEVQVALQARIAMGGMWLHLV
jgi:hypothetical protein